MIEIKFPTISEMAKEVAEKALDEYAYEGKTIRQWIEILKDYDDKQSTLQDIVERLEEEIRTYRNSDWLLRDKAIKVGTMITAMDIVKEVGGMNG